MFCLDPVLVYIQQHPATDSAPSSVESCRFIITQLPHHALPLPIRARPAPMSTTLRPPDLQNTTASANLHRRPLHRAATHDSRGISLTCLALDTRPFSRHHPSGAATVPSRAATHTTSGLGQPAGHAAGACAPWSPGAQWQPWQCSACLRACRPARVWREASRGRASVCRHEWTRPRSHCRRAGQEVKLCDSAAALQRRLCPSDVKRKRSSSSAGGRN
jgi:hypothetical protein